MEQILRGVEDYKDLLAHFLKELVMEGTNEAIDAGEKSVETIMLVVGLGVFNCKELFVLQLCYEKQRST